VTCVILQDGSRSADDQHRVAEYPSSLGEDLSGRETGFVEDPFGSPEVPRRWRTRKSHYIAPPLIPINPEYRPIIKPISEVIIFHIPNL
jgi:hypothetical protein